MVTFHRVDSSADLNLQGGIKKVLKRKHLPKSLSCDGGSGQGKLEERTEGPGDYGD